MFVCVCVCACVCVCVCVCNSVCVCVQYLEAIRIATYENLKNLTFAPSVQMHDVPPDLCLENPEEPDPDMRPSEEEMDKR